MDLEKATRMVVESAEPLFWEVAAEECPGVSSEQVPWRVREALRRAMRKALWEALQEES